MMNMTDEYCEFSDTFGITHDNGSRAEVFNFSPANGVGERHLMFKHLFRGVPFKEQMEAMLENYHSILEEEMPDYTPVFRRIFLSDIANQADLLNEELAKETSVVATSVVEQAPLDGTKIAMWVYLVKGAECKALDNGLVECRMGDYRHLWTGTTTLNSGDSREQTTNLLNNYADQLKVEGLSLENDCVRTWFFVQNVDANYKGVVDGRNDVFANHNMTPHTHYISSTGIGGRNADLNALVQMNTYAVGGLQPGQMKFLYAKNHMNPTHEYGVAFERGTYIDYSDRRHVFISGTASIDNKGEVVHKGDIKLQVERMWNNVEALLNEADCTWNNVGQMIVYLRDPSDHLLVSNMFCKKFGERPHVIVLAPVCRPGWLVEMECMAVKEIKE